MLRVVLYEALIGRRPFEAETPLAVALMHVHNPLPLPRQVRPDLPEALERILLRALAKNPDDRFQSAAEMATALRAVPLEPIPVTPEVPATPNRGPLPQMPTPTPLVTMRLPEDVPASLVVQANIQTNTAARPDTWMRLANGPLKAPLALAIALLGIALNISIGHVVTTVWALPLFLDSIGTILVAALLGPWAGLIVGFVSHVIWTLTGLSSGTLAIWFSYATAVQGLIVGLAGRAGVFSRKAPHWLAAIIGAVGLFALTYYVLVLLSGPYDEIGNYAEFPWVTDLVGRQPLLFIIASVGGAVLGYARLQRVAYSGLAGLLTGVIAAVIAEPMVTYLFRGFRDSGPDTIGALFSTTAEHLLDPLLGNGRVASPFDLFASFLIAWLILQIVPRWYRER